MTWKKGKEPGEMNSNTAAAAAAAAAQQSSIFNITYHSMIFGRLREPTNSHVAVTHSLNFENL
jgi:hypothetical protein